MVIVNEVKNKSGATQLVYNELSNWKFKYKERKDFK